MQNTNMPPLMYGTAWKKEHTADLVEMAIMSGFRGIDTACQPKHYNEAGVGEALERLAAHGILREELFLQTKFTPLSGQDPARIPYDPNAPLEMQVAQSFEASKRNLRTEYVDSLVLHSPLFPYAHLQKVWEAMEGIYHSGGALRLGISNCYDLELLKRLYANTQIKPAVVQNRFYAESGYDIELRAWCESMNITYQSFWSLTANPHILGSKTVFALGRKYDKTEAQIFYRYLCHKGIVPLIGSTSKQHIDEDLAIFTFELEANEIMDISSLLEA
ncbi:MAG: aldo/keto reductase [Sulfuricurvum sp.]|uniref:aldo/keto reductase family protein n=1 Tax=Sulfuricurvum sp. TaxID=2025608 RepID=UPI002603C073|nr:aldo/keto reductase [Sulfuricurvum sp.]MDD2368226.1 aldo/keto reductase [Sulfuricurvum sp.]MDD2950196.1 aldo/keto reductase [Sulfuricurvum sp.]MDD5118830.1 aldo/keto reductase [Sulfuricurvum sp.]